MKNHPDIIPKLWEKCIALGYNDDTIKVPTSNPVPKSFQAEAMGKRKYNQIKEEAAKVEESLNADAGSYTVVDAVPTKYWKMSELTVPIWRDRLLPRIETSSLSAANIRCIRDKEAASKEGLCRIAEFATGLSADFALTGRYRCLEQLAKLMVDRAQRRGRRCLDLPLPPRWPTDGIYFVQGYDEAQTGIIVCHKFLNQHVVVSRSSVAGHSSLAELEVVYNWSEQKAAIGKKGQLEGMHILLNYFSTQEVQEESDSSNAKEAFISPAKRYRRIMAKCEPGAMSATPPCAKKEITSPGDVKGGCEGVTESCQGENECDATGLKDECLPDAVKASGSDDAADGREIGMAQPVGITTEVGVVPPPPPPAP